jgi:hypothetical protein
MEGSVGVVRVVHATVKGVNVLPLARFIVGGEAWVPRSAWEESGLWSGCRSALGQKLPAVR